MTIEYYAQDNYGNEQYYIKDANFARFFEMLTGHKAITLTEMNLITLLSGNNTTFKLTHKPL